jgi:hypothetical protein
MCTYPNILKIIFHFHTVCKLKLPAVSFWPEVCAGFTGLLTKHRWQSLPVEVLFVLFNKPIHFNCVQ